MYSGESGPRALIDGDAMSHIASLVASLKARKLGCSVFEGLNFWMRMNNDVTSRHQIMRTPKYPEEWNKAGDVFQISHLPSHISSRSRIIGGWEKTKF